MIRSLARHRTAGKWMLVGSVMALSCTQPPVVGRTPQLDIRAQDVYPEDWKTPLPEGVDPNPDTFRANLTRVSYAQGPSYVRLRAGKDCGGCVISVRITAFGNTRSIDPDRPPHPGRPLAHIKNLDATITEAYYGLKPGADADYFLWIDRRDDRPDSARITLIEVPHRSDLRVHGGRQKNLYVCNGYTHGTDPTTDPSQGADFVEYRHPEGCRYPAPYMAITKSGQASMLSSSAIAKAFARFAELLGIAYLISGGGWIDCNSGCCT